MVEDGPCISRGRSASRKQGGRSEDKRNEVTIPDVSRDGGGRLPSLSAESMENGLSKLQQLSRLVQVSFMQIPTHNPIILTIRDQQWDLPAGR